MQDLERFCSYHRIAASLGSRDIGNARRLIAGGAIQPYELAQIEGKLRDKSRPVAYLLGAIEGLRRDESKASSGDRLPLKRAGPTAKPWPAGAAAFVNGRGFVDANENLIADTDGNPIQATGAAS